jgi:O-antigen/teichoic acid export membrane protein
LLLALLPVWGLTGALLAVLLMEVMFCFLGVWGVRDYWRAAELRIDRSFLRPYVRFGLSFFLANLAAVALYRSGPALVELLSGDSRQTGYFNLALGLFLLAYVTVSQFAQGLIPMLSGFRAAGQTTQLRQWLHNFVRYGWWLSWLGVIAVWLLADWSVPLIFGPEFIPAAASLKWISLGIPLTTILWTGNVLATVTGQGGVKFGGALVALLTFIIAAVWLTPLFGATGAALALSLAVGVNVAILAVYLQPDLVLNWRMLGSGLMAGVICLGVLTWLGFR